MTPLSRRSSIKLGIAGFAGAALPFSARVLEGADNAVKGGLTGLLENEDCTDIFFHQKFPPEGAGAVVDRYIDVIAGAGVTVLMCNTNARRTNYRSDVWEAFWDGYDREGPDDQPFFASVPPESREDYRRLVGNMLELHRQGVDYPDRVIRRCRLRGVSPWISLRMNDVHYNSNLDHPFHGEFWRRPELFRRGDPGYYARALDYAHPEVRERYRVLIAETLDRYDVDGLELDFLREPYLFSKGREQEGRPILTEWLRGVRALVEAAAIRRGRPIRLGVRVPSSPDTALGLGLDAPKWARDGLVDLVVAAPRWATLEFNMPLAEWRRLLGERVTLAGGLEILYGPYPGARQRRTTREEANGAAVAVLSGGADVVYLFNHFQHGQEVSEYQRRLRAFTSLEALVELPRRHAVTYRDVKVPGGSQDTPLPAVGKRLSFSLPLGPAPAAGWIVEVAVELASQPADAPLPVVSINGVAGKALGGGALKDGARELTCVFPATVVSGQNRDAIFVDAAGEDPITVRRVEVGLRPGG